MTGKQIQAARRKAGLTCQGLAAQIGCSVGAVHAWEVGTRKPKPDMLEKLHIALNVVAR